MVDNVYYIRTGDEITLPFRIPLWVRFLVVLFACYFVWITVEFLKVYFLIPELIKIESDVLAKYEVAERLEAAGAEIDLAITRSDIIQELLTEELSNERPAYH